MFMYFCKHFYTETVLLLEEESSKYMYMPKTKVMLTLARHLLPVSEGRWGHHCHRTGS